MKIKINTAPKFNFRIALFTLALFSGLIGKAQIAPIPDSTKTPIVVKDKNPHWYEKISIRGYFQFRYNRAFEDNINYKCEQCDKNWGDKTTFSIRRSRMIFFGQVSQNVYIYIQPDLANLPSSSSSSGHFMQLRDAYFDWSFDKKREFRIRVGQSKVPFGFENMQSSQNRLPLDRNDAMNSAVSNERDLGAFFYWAPKKVRELYKMLVDSNLKGSGDYGCFGLGMYNGQTANKVEQNNNMHTAIRFTYPIKIFGQIIEPGVQAYTGMYTMSSDQLTSGTKTNATKTYKNERVAGTFVLYPQPFGVQAEYNIGVGPQYLKNTDSISTEKLNGGYITLSYKFKIKAHAFIPYARYTYYQGGKKHETDARAYEVEEWEGGVEYQPYRNVEFVICYLNGRRRFEDKAKETNYQKGSLVRMQLQFNF